jgi:cholesterol oxidase
MDFDVIVIGSGFGGAITACRLAEANYRVLILERGRRWNKDNYPRKPTDMWIWNHEDPTRHNGWLDLRLWPNMTVACGAAVGGGSLIYANVSTEAPEDTFQTAKGWPGEITYQELKPYYDRVAQFMNVQEVPDNQWTKRMKTIKDSADAAGAGGRFRKLPLAVSFDPNWNYDLPDPYDHGHSRRFINAQGVEQGTCVHLGQCDAGCPVDAKNTLDRNYIPWAEKHHADVREMHIVTAIAPVTGGYQVNYDVLHNGGRVPGKATARIVIVAAGSLGSTELLLRAQKQFQTLPGLSPKLGRDWSSNGDFLTPALHPSRDISPTRGPTIGAAISFLDGSYKGQKFWVQDGGIPDVLSEQFESQFLPGAISSILGHLDPLKHIMPWFAQGVDAGNGHFELKSRPGSAPKFHLHWDIRQSEPVIDAIIAKHNELARATKGQVLVPLSWVIGKDLITPHPLGGCNMGNTWETGVVDHRGEVFGYKNLYVADAAIIPEALGVNPSRTIGALAERIAKIIKNESR